MKTKNKTLVLGGGYMGLSEGYGNLLIVGLMRTISVHTAYPFVALIYDTDSNMRNERERPDKTQSQNKE